MRYNLCLRWHQALSTRACCDLYNEGVQALLDGEGAFFNHSLLTFHYTALSFESRFKMLVYHSVKCVDVVRIRGVVNIGIASVCIFPKCWLTMTQLMQHLI
jgi:hypothetical protein